MRALLAEAASVAAADAAPPVASALVAVVVCAACAAALAAVCGLCGGSAGGRTGSDAHGSSDQHRSNGTGPGYVPPGPTPTPPPRSHSQRHRPPSGSQSEGSHQAVGNGYRPDSSFAEHPRPVSAQERPEPTPPTLYPRGALRVEEANAAGVAAFLQKASVVTAGALPPRCRMDDASIVPGLNAARVNIKDVYGIDATALFFAPPEKCRQHLRVHHKCLPFAPVLRQNENAPGSTLTRTDDSEAGGHTRDGGGGRRGRPNAIKFHFPEVEHRLPTGDTSVIVPAHIRLERCTSLVEELRRLDSAHSQAPRSAAAASAALQQLFQVVLQLNAFLRHAHENEYVMRDITIGNVVFAQLQAQRGWTLLEYTKACRVGKRSQSVTAHTSPPEMAHLVQTAGDVPLAFSYDMWQLGMLVYQLASQPWPYSKPYWPAPGTPGAPSDSQILQALADYHNKDNSAANPHRTKLPHERSPLQNETLRQIVEKLLTPIPEPRWTSEDLRVHLELNTTSLTMRGQAQPQAS